MHTVLYIPHSSSHFTHYLHYIGQKLTHTNRPVCWTPKLWKVLPDAAHLDFGKTLQIQWGNTAGWSQSEAAPRQLCSGPKMPHLTTLNMLATLVYTLFVSAPFNILTSGPEALLIKFMLKKTGTSSSFDEWPKQNSELSWDWNSGLINGEKNAKPCT